MKPSFTTKIRYHVMQHWGIYLALLSGIVISFVLYSMPLPSFPPATGYASGEVFEARVIAVQKEKYVVLSEGAEAQLQQTLTAVGTTGAMKGVQFSLQNGDIPMAKVSAYQVGDELVLSKMRTDAGGEQFFISDTVRRKPLFILSLLFLAVVVLVGGWHGVSSLAGMVYSFVVIFRYILPRILSGQDPVTVAVSGALLIVPVTFILSHGLNRKTIVASISTLLVLYGVGLLSGYFSTWAGLTGFSSEEAGFLQAFTGGTVKIEGLFLASVIIGGLGVLDDITISQAAIVSEVRTAAPTLSTRELFFRGMRVGRDHIASMVNTLVLVYTGAALPLFLLFLQSSRSFGEVVNYEFIADEIIRTLVSSIGLILAVPVTTLFSSLVYPPKEESTAK